MHAHTGAHVLTDENPKTVLPTHLPVVGGIYFALHHLHLQAV